jgi:hypothetical protein
MQRLIDQPVGDGEVFLGGLHIARVHYHLSVYQHFSDIEGESVPANIEVEGRITPLDQVDLLDLHRRGLEFTLHLADGRRLDFSIANEDGMIRSTGRGFMLS